MSLTFNQLRAANRARLPLFTNKHGEKAHSKPDGSDWTVAQWFQAWLGEVGEFAEVRCSFESGAIGYDEYVELARKELPDSLIYQDLLSHRALDLTEIGGQDDRAQILMRLVSRLGLYANLSKKVDRGDKQPEALKTEGLPHLQAAGALLEELAEDGHRRRNRKTLRAGHGIDLGAAVTDKFNEVSDRVGCDVRLQHNTTAQPDFDAVRDKALSDLTPEQRDDAYELWLRTNLGWMTAYNQPHYAFLLKRLDEVREQLTRSERT